MGSSIIAQDIGYQRQAYEALGYEEIVSPRIYQERTNITQWETISPFNIEKARGNHYVELVTKKVQDAIDMKAWVRLIDESGKIYSIGLDTSAFFNDRNLQLISPVYNEFVHTEENATRFLISAEIFTKLKTKIEADKKAGLKKDDQPTCFIFSKKSSLSYATELLNEAGIELKNKELLVIDLSRKACKLFGIDMPNWVEKIINAVADFFKSILKPINSVLNNSTLTVVFPILKVLNCLPSTFDKEDFESVSLDKTQKFQNELTELRTQVVSKFKNRDIKQQKKIIKQFNKQLKLNLTTSKEAKHLIRNTTEKVLSAMQQIINDF